MRQFRLGRGADGIVWVVLGIGLLTALVAVLLWRQNMGRLRVQRERAQRRARTDQMLARALVGEERHERHTVGGPHFGAWQTTSSFRPGESTAARTQTDEAPVIESLLRDESDTVVARARRELGRPTTQPPSAGGMSTLQPVPRREGEPAVSLLDGRLDVSLDALVVAWFAARGYLVARAPVTAQPIRLLLTHRDDPERSYAFCHESGRLPAQRASSLLELALALGAHRLLVAAEQGAEPAVYSARLRDVLVMDWVAIDQELKKIDFRVAAKLVAFARTRRRDLGLD